MPGLEQGRILRQPRGQFPEDALHFFAFGVFEGKDFIIELDRFFGFDKGSPAGIAFSMQDTFDLAFMLGKDRHDTAAVEKRLFDIGDIPGFCQSAQNAVEKPSQLIPPPE